MPPEVVVFDLGKVLVDFDYGIAARRIADNASLDAIGIQRVLDQSTLLFRYETGLLTREEFFKEIREATGYRGTLEIFSGYFADVFSPIDPMIALHAALRKRGVPTCIFSNTNDLAVAHIRRNFPFFANFDGYVFSYEHGSMKPETRLYEVVEQATGRTQGAILYLDDRLENIEAGRARGWQTIHHQTPQASIARVAELQLVRPDSL
jgi:HAD superfamily hydrolase (TIGR01509 family)